MKWKIDWTKKNKTRGREYQTNLVNDVHDIYLFFFFHEFRLRIRENKKLPLLVSLFEKTKKRPIKNIMKNGGGRLICFLCSPIIEL